ncbi:MAG TPA: hypothetical protein VKV21_14825 [Solirubrobacteraceae bacterium]|nr:hypothetical protein [Solirubrobacteraceae bacterium]
MSGTVLSPHRSLEPGHGVPTIWTHVSAWLRRGRLDQELATGIPSWESPRHAARALQLTRRSHRTALAQGLNRVLQEVRRTTPRMRRMSCVMPCRGAVLRCAPLLEELADVLAGDLPLDPMRVARLHILIRDGAGPFYCPRRSGELHHALELIRAGIVADD